jgi:hypothetical protein
VRQAAALPASAREHGHVDHEKGSTELGEVNWPPDMLDFSSTIFEYSGSSLENDLSFDLSSHCARRLRRG